MKALLFALTAIVSGSAFAGEFTQIGKIEFQSASAWISGNSVCQKDGVLYHKTLPALEVEYCNNHHSNCHTVLKPLAQPMHSTREICVAFTGREQSGCRAWKSVPFNQTSYTVSVFASRHAMDESGTPSKVYTYAIPACKAPAPTPAN